MTWADEHRQSEALAADASLAIRGGRVQEALALYAQAAAKESTAFAQVDRSKARTLAATAISAVALWYKARQFDEAEQLAFRILAEGKLGEHAHTEVKNLLQAIWAEALLERAGLKFARGDVLIAVRGGEVVYGGAPLDLILRKVEQVSALIYRTAELLVNAPHRKRGFPDQQIRDICRPWLFQAAPGSYQFAIRVQKTPQMPLFPQLALDADAVAPKLLQIIRASAEDPEKSLPEIVPDREYRATFLKMTRNLAPTGKSFSQLEVRPAWPSEEPPVTLMAKSRASLGDAIRRQAPRKDAAPRSQVRLQGVLRALHLDQDWIELTITDQAGEQHIRVNGAGETVDDIIGPMVNRPVILEAIVTPGGRYNFVDIQPAE